MEYLTYYYRYTILHWLWYNHTRRHLPLLSPWQYLKVAKFLSVVNKAPSMRLIYVVSLSHPTLLYHIKIIPIWKARRGSRLLLRFSCFYTFLSLTAYKIIEKKRNNKTFSKKVSKKSCVRGHNRKKESYLRNMIIPTKGRKFRRKYASDKEPTNTRTYKSFFSKKVSKSHFSV